MSHGKILCEVSIETGASEWYGTIDVTNIRYEDGSAVAVEEYLGILFISPAWTTEPDVNLTLSSWTDNSPEVVHDDNGDGTFDVTARIIFSESHTFAKGDVVKFGISGDMMNNSDLYKDSFELYADTLPSGTVEVSAAAAPDEALADAKQVIELLRGGLSTPLSIRPGETQSFTVPSGKYTVQGNDLTNSDETIVAVAQASPAQIALETDAKITINVSYGGAQQFSSIDLKIGQLSSPVDNKQLHAKVIEHDTGKQLPNDFFSPNNHTTKIRRLPASGAADVSVELTVNNVRYLATQTVQLKNDLTTVTIDEDKIKTEDVDDSDFVDLPVKVQTDFNKSGSTILVQLLSTSLDWYYTETFDASKTSSKLSEPVKPGQYTVKVSGFIDGSTVYGVVGPTSLSVAKDGSTTLELTVKQGANLKVRGFPDYMSFGGISNLADLTGADFIAADASAVFKYSGNDGMGDTADYLQDEPATETTVKLAATIQEAVGHSVLPVMVSYTVNLSLGGYEEHLQTKDWLEHSFGNYILSMKVAKETSKESVPAGYIVNPDFLGECQKQFSPSYVMPVLEPLENALAHFDLDLKIPDEVDNTLKGYVLAVNWLTRSYGENVTFGWQVNLWGVGNSEWIYLKDETPETPATAAKKTADYIKSLDVYSGDYKPDFLAIDRYEADDFAKRGYSNGYCYGPYEWGRYYDFCGALSLELQVPVVPWQIPASRIPNVNEEVTNLEKQQWGTGGTYIFGDDQVNSDYHNIHPAILAIKPTFPPGSVTYKTVKEIFEGAGLFDLSYPTYTDFPLRGIVAVWLGGGATTGIIQGVGTTGPWTQEHISSYMENPIPLSTTSKGRVEYRRNGY